MLKYQERYTYDAKGNILSLERNGDKAYVFDMDSLTYSYYANTNRLNHVWDFEFNVSYDENIDRQSPGNYEYDASGNLTQDAAEGLTISWNAYGKIQQVVNDSTGQTIKFGYDASGNRVSKNVIAGTDRTVTYYIRDAQGNVLSHYQLKNDTIVWNEMVIYGSSRLG